MQVSFAGWPHRLTARTAPFHGVNRGSIPREVTTFTMAEVLKIQSPEDVAEVAQRAAEVLRRGGIILYPTDTIYGLGADALSDEAVQKIYNIKGREEGKPIHALVSDLAMAARYADLSKETNRTLIEKHMFQPVSWICPKQPGVGSGILRGIETFGFRIPNNQFCLELTKAFENPVTATSANKSGEPPKNSIEDILEQLGDGAQYIDLVIDVGPLPPSLPSTVVDLSQDPPRILRQGKAEIFLV